VYNLYLNQICQHEQITVNQTNGWITHAESNLGLLFTIQETAQVPKS